MRRALLAIALALLLVACAGQPDLPAARSLGPRVAMLQRGNPLPAPGCTFTGATTNGSCVNVANGQTLGPDSNGFTWKFSNAGCDTNTPPNCNYLVGSPGFSFFDKGFQAIWQSPLGAFYATDFPTCGSIYRYYTGTPGINPLATAPGTPLGSGFLVAGDGSSQKDIPEMMSHTATAHTATVNPQPAPWNCYPVVVNGFTAGMTLAFAAGTAIGDNTNRLGELVIDAANITAQGDATTPLDLRGEIRVVDSSTNPTLKNIHVSHNSQSSGGTASCYLGGGKLGTITLSGLTLEDCGFSNGANFGQDHGLYQSINVGDASAAIDCIAADHITVRNIWQGGWLYKLRPGCQGSASTLTQFTGNCTFNSAHCELNGALDIPCGGNYTISHGVLERGPAGDNWYMVRVGEEIPGGVGPTCSTVNNTVPYANTTVVLDSIWFVWDGPCPGAASSGVAILVCAGTSTCTLPGVSGWSPSITVKNSKIVSDPSGCNFANSLGPGVTDGGGNTFFASRAAAGLAAFPAVPAIF